jgi:hypothetical protein
MSASLPDFSRYKKCKRERGDTYEAHDSVFYSDCLYFGFLFNVDAQQRKRRVQPQEAVSQPQQSTERPNPERKKYSPMSAEEVAPQTTVELDFWPNGNSLSC